MVGLPVLTGLVGLLTLVAASEPAGMDGPLFIPLLLGWPGLVVLWVALFILDRGHRQPGAVPIRTRFWLAGPVITAVVVALLVADVPARTRFALSESSLERSARAIAAGEELPVDDRWIGLYHVPRTDPFDNGTVHFTLGRTRYGFGGTGFAWVPDPRNLQANTDAGGYSYELIDGNWYRWHQVD